MRLDGAAQMILISGSNMSGKSTMLRTVGVNAVLVAFLLGLLKTE